MLGLLLNRLMRKGTLRVIHPSGKMEAFGEGAPHVTVEFHDVRAIPELVLNPDLKLGELYMEGRLTVEDGTVADMLDLLMMNLGAAQPSGLHKLARKFRTLTRRFAQFNPASKAKENVAHHYDLDGRLYDLFLGRDKQYSCAYFSAPGETLEEAQIGKKRHIAAKLHLDKPNLKVLDIGCGWGGLALNLAQDCRADVLGVTLSEENWASRASVRRPRSSRTPAASSWWIIARWAGATTASYRWACSSMSARPITTPFLPRSETFSATTA